MTERTAIEWLKTLSLWTSMREEPKEACKVAIKALENMQKLEENKTYLLYREYLSLGTVEELRALKEKQIAKKPIVQGLGQRYCPICRCGGAHHQYCARCGQKLDSEV